MYIVQHAGPAELSDNKNQTEAHTELSLTCPRTGLLEPTAAARGNQQCPAEGTRRLQLPSDCLKGRPVSGRTLLHAKQAHLACLACSMTCIPGATS